MPSIDIDYKEIKEKAVTTAKLDDGAVTSAKLADSSISSGDIANNAVITTKIADLNVTEGKLAANAVTAAKMKGGATVNQVLVTSTANTTPTWANVTSAMITDGTIGAADLASNSVTEAKIESGAVTTAKIADYNISADKLAAGAVITDKIAASAVTEGKLGNYCISNVKILDSAINSAKIADGTIVNADIANATIEASKLKGSATVGQVLTTSTANAAPTWTTPTSGGVSQITAGTNVTISPTGGTGNVTINASAAAGGQVNLPDAAIMSGLTCDTAAAHPGVISIKYLWENAAVGSSVHYRVTAAQMTAATTSGIDVQYGYRTLGNVSPSKWNNTISDIHVVKNIDGGGDGFIRVQYSGGASLLWPRVYPQYDSGGYVIIPHPWSLSYTIDAPTVDRRAYPYMPWIHETQRMVIIPSSTTTPTYQCMCRIPARTNPQLIKGSYSTYGTIRIFIRDIYERNFKTGTSLITAVTACWDYFEGAWGGVNCVEGNTYCEDSTGSYNFNGAPMGHKFAGCSSSWLIDGNEVSSDGLPTTCIGYSLAWEITDTTSHV